MRTWALDAASRQRLHTRSTTPTAHPPARTGAGTATPVMHDFAAMSVLPDARWSEDPMPQQADAPVPAEPLPAHGDEAQPMSTPTMDVVNVITSSTGAFSGFPIAKGIDLNKPGPFNDTTTTGSCVNVHQMQFHLASGSADEVKLIRRVVRVGTAGGKTSSKGEKDKPADDGPSAGSVIRPKGGTDVVVADAPGFVASDPAKSAGAFPVGYDADFVLFATDAVQPRLLAKLEYSVKIAKKAFTDTAPTNELTMKSNKVVKKP